MRHFMASFIPVLIGGAVGSTLPLALAIVIGTFILEDVTVVVVGLLAAEGIVGVPVALLSLYGGIILGDFGLYMIGRYASIHPHFEKYVDHDVMTPFRNWIDNRFVFTVFTARFIPGMRLPTYTASGFFGSSLSRFMSTAVVAATVWTAVLFTAVYWFGSATEEWIGGVRFGIACFIAIVIFTTGFHNIRKYHRRRKEIKAMMDEFEALATEG